MLVVVWEKNVLLCLEKILGHTIVRTLVQPELFLLRPKKNPEEKKQKVATYPQDLSCW